MKPRIGIALLALCVVIFVTIVAHAEIRNAAIRPAAITPLSKTVTAAQLGTINNRALVNLSSIAAVDDQMYGAGEGKLATIGDDGQITSTVPIGVSRVAGLSGYAGGLLLVGDADKNTVMTVDPKTGQTNKLFALAEIRAEEEEEPVQSLIARPGMLASVAYDGANVYIATQAGYSSSIFRINTRTNRATAHAWSPGPTPTAMTVDKGNLFVLDSSGQKIRRFDPNMKLDHNSIDIPVQDGKGIIIKGDEVRVLSSKASGIVRLRSDMRVLTQPVTALSLSPTLSKAIITAILAPQKYAVLICGDVAESGYNEFWNDTCWMYKTLRDAGYTAENILVLYGNGNDYACANPKYQSTERVTDFPATVTWVNKVFDGLKNGDAASSIPKMKDNDTLFVWTFDHGSGGSLAYLCLMDGTISDTNFASKLNAIPYESRAIFMQQCRSGGFIDNLQNSKTFISTACLATENAHRSDNENEYYNNKWYYHGEYNYWIICALSGKTPAGANVNADSNGNGKVSMREVHTWNTSHESDPATPQMNDMGNIGLNFCIK